MSLETAMILVKALFDTYYNEYGMTVSIREEERATVAEGAWAEMTDNKIIKALECLRGNAFDCGECPYCSCYPAPCEQQVAKDALSLINRQKEEVKKLQVFKSYFDEL